MIRMECYTSIREIPVSVWEHFVSLKTVGLEIGHLQAVEDSCINNIRPYYIIGYRGDKPVGIAYCFSINVDLAGMTRNYPPHIIKTVRTWRPGFMKVRIVEAGHLASLGATIETGQQDPAKFLQAMSGKMDEIARIEKADLCLIRDIPSSHFRKFCVLKEFGYQPVIGFPIARMQLRWNNFDGYLESLKSRKRNNIMHKRAKIQVPEITVEVIEDYSSYSERLAGLWKNVARRNNGYEHEKLSPAYFEAMSYHLKGRSHVVAIKHHKKIVAYGLNLVGDEEYFGVAEGLDYSVRDKYDLYANNIFEGIRVACELQKMSFNIGITAYDFKTSIGAELDWCIYFVKAFKEPRYSAVYADFIKKNITQPENCHRVFSNSNNKDRQQPKDIKNLLNNRDEIPDPFIKHKSCLRADTVREADIYPFYPVFESAQEAVIRHKGRDVIMLGTNSYLGLATHPKIKKAAQDAITIYGSGCSGSPMLNGTLKLHRQLADKLSRFMHKQDALIFSTGYQTNVGVISALANRDDILIMDERNHASLTDGARLSGASLVRYKHNNPDSLEQVLKKYAGQPKMVVTDSLFSMEGTVIDLPRIVYLAGKYHARLLLDESHAIGVMGSTGRGVAEYYGMTDMVDVITGTFSKSFASIGGFVAGDRTIIDSLKHTSRSHIFSASLPPAAVATVLAAIEIIDEEPERRTVLLENSKFMADALRNLGYHITYNNTPVIPVFCGHELLTITAFHKLFDEGVYVNPVTSPAVPRSQEILRISLMATHNKRQLSCALEIFERIRTTHWPSGKQTDQDMKNQNHNGNL